MKNNKQYPLWTKQNLSKGEIWIKPGYCIDIVVVILIIILKTVTIRETGVQEVSLYSFL